MDNATIIGLAVGISIAVIGLVGGFILFKRKNMGNSDFQQTLL
jgi:LPXTG-motif cell wall-anchored protein